MFIHEVPTWPELRCRTSAHKKRDGTRLEQFCSPALRRAGSEEALGEIKRARATFARLTLPCMNQEQREDFGNHLRHQPLLGGGEAPPEELFHYTKAAAFMSIVEHGSLWATHFRYLNDTGEHDRGLELAREVLLNLQPTRFDREFVRDAMVAGESFRMSEMYGPFVLSLTENPNQLSQWRGYADNGSGYSIGFYTDSLPFRARLRRCVYGEDEFCAQVQHRFFDEIEQHIAGLIDLPDAPIHVRRRQAMASLESHLRSLATSYKPKAFDEESEWRTVLFDYPELVRPNFRAGPRGLIPYLDVPLRTTETPTPLSKVYVGPTQAPQDGRRATCLFLETLGYTDVEILVRNSGIPYRP